MPNTLALGSRRHGALIDFDPDTPPVSVTLMRTKAGISLTIPWESDSSPYASWFTKGFQIDGPEQRDPPHRLLFSDSHGRVELVGCWARGYHLTVGGPGSGTVWASYAVLGADGDADFSTVHGVRSSIPGLRAWVGSESVTESTHAEFAEHKRFAVTASREPNIEIGGSPKLTLVPGWNITRTEDGRTIKDRLYAETRSEAPKSWEELLRPHDALADLLTLSQWRDEQPRPEYAMQFGDPLRTLDGRTHGEQWRQVVRAWHRRIPKPPTRREHLIEYADLGPRGLEKWLNLRQEFSRAYDPIIFSRRLTRVNADTLLAQAAPGLEALGYLLLIRDRATPSAAASSILRTRLERILRDIRGVIPFDGDKWVAGTVDTYNGLKHANRTLPDHIDILNRWRESVFAVRLWTAVELGTPLDELAERARRDDQSHPWEEVRRSAPEPPPPAL